MHRFYVDAGNIEGKWVNFPERELKHLKQVLRLTTGDEVLVFDGLGREYLVRLEKEGGEIIALSEPASEPRLKVTLAQGIAKGDKMDYIIQKAVELGVSRIIPLMTDYTVVKLADKEEKKRERWQRIAEEACKQCERAYIPRVERVCSLDYLTGYFTGAYVGLFCYEEERKGERNLRKVMERLKEDRNEEVLLIVGPEGGFSEREALVARQAGWHIVGLGPRVLRTETASLAALSIIMYELADLG